MKYIFLFILSILTMGSQAQKGFVLKGTIKGYETGEIYLLKMDSRTDTLAQGQIKNGHFKLTGHTSLPQAAYIRIKNVVNGPDLFLENTHITAHLKIKEAYTASPKGQLIPVKELENELNSDIQGGKDQDIANIYWQLFSQATRQFDSLQIAYKKAADKSDQKILKHLEEKEQKLRKTLIEKAQKLISQYSDSYVSAFIIREYLMDLYEDESEVVELYQLLADQARNSAYGKKIASNLSLNLTPQEGEIIPDFILTDLNHISQSLYQIEGKIKILDFWAGWCATCLSEMPELSKLYDKYKSQGIQFITITLDKDQNLANELQKKMNLTWISLGSFQSTDTDIQALFNIRTVPYRIILDQNNRIIKKGNMTLHQLSENIDSLLKLL